MAHRVDRVFGLLLALALGITPGSCPGAEPVPGSTSPAGAIRLASGVTAHYTYHYNRNALADVLRTGDAPIARTDSGNLLRFDRATLALTREWFGSVPASCLGRGENGAVLAGFIDGRIGRIDPVSLAMTELARLTGKVQWVGVITAGAGAGQPARPRLVAVVVQEKPFDYKGKTYQVPCSVVHEVGSSKTYDVYPTSEYPSNLSASAFLLDSKHRLWLGADRGEWGGWCCYVDLDAGKIHSILGLKVYETWPRELWLGVFGFAELRDGQVWAHGGTTHMGSTEGFIWRVDRGKAEELYRLDNEPPKAKARRKKEMAEAKRAEKDEEEEVLRLRREFKIPPEVDDPAKEPKPEPEDQPEPEPDPLPTDRPYLPITNVVEDAGTGAIAVVSFSGIYRTDARLARWEKVHELKIRYRGGRPDSVGAYPSVRAVLPVERRGQAMGLLFATRLDGLIRLADGQETGQALPGQLDAEYVGRIENSAEGLLVVERSDEGHPGRFADGAWSRVSFAPPFAPAGPDAIEAQARPPLDHWYESTTLVNRDGSIVTISSSGWSPGTRTMSRWRDGKAQILGSEVSSLNPSTCFLTPDGGIWNADDGILSRFAEGRWVKAADFRWPRGVGREGWRGIGWGLRAVHDAGPPWILHDHTNELLLRLAYGPGFKDPELTITPLIEAGQAQRLKVRDAIPWAKGELLLATDRGLRTLAIDGDKLAAPPLNNGGQVASHLARDGRGRLWLAGEGLVVLEADRKTIHPLDELPMLGRSKIEALAADPADPDGVLAAIEGRGVVFVRVERSPAAR
jgi:hypothetical protein